MQTNKKLWLLTASAATLVSGSAQTEARTEKPKTSPREAKESKPKTPAFAQIMGVKTSTSGDDTLVDITLRGETAPLLSQKGKQVTLLLPGSIPSSELASNLALNLEDTGMVTRMGIEVSPLPLRDSRLTFDLSQDARCALVSSPGRKTIRVRIFPAETEKREPQFTVSEGLFDVNAYQTDLSSLLTSLAKTVGGSVAMLGTSPKVTAQLKGVSFEQAVSMLSKSAGMSYRKEGEVFIVAGEKEMAVAFPLVKQDVIPLATPVMKQEVYRCRYIVASTLVRSIVSMFEPNQLKVGVGADHTSPSLVSPGGSSGTVTGLSSSTIAASSSSVDGVSSGASSSASSTSGSLSNSTSRVVILYGEASLVDRALDLARKIDIRRKQVRINVRITDVNSEALRELGLRWNWSNFSVKEQPSTSASTGGSTSSGTPSGTGSTAGTDPLVNSISFGAFGHTPVYIDAKLSALEQNNKAKLLASPNLTLLDGERSFIQIGQKILYPVVVSLSQNNQPNYSVQQERVGIYMQVAVLIDENDEFTITLYPQVSSITGFLNVNGASYPQVSTREEQTTVRMKSGQQMVVGGLIRDEEINTREAVPILSKIPFFGELFNYRKKTRSKSEVIVTIEPEILKD